MIYSSEIQCIRNAGNILWTILDFLKKIDQNIIGVVNVLYHHGIN
jgi:hypothetical protein